MKTFRIILAILAIMPIALLTDAILLHPENYGENSMGELALQRRFTLQRHFEYYYDVLQWSRFGDRAWCFLCLR